MSKRQYILAGLVMVILTIPFVAMQFTNEVNWSVFDFVIAGVILSVFAFLIDFSLRKIHTKQNKILVVLALIGSLLLLWAELAVGIFGTPLAGS